MIMTLVKQWIAFFLLMLASASALASIPLMTLVLPDGRQIALDDAALAALPQTQFKTATPWTTDMHDYRGPTLAAVLAAQGVKNVSKIAVSALNGYQQVVDLALFEEAPLTLVRHEDGKPLTRRNKGPLWLLIPLSSYPKLDIPLIHNCMVWQVTRIEIIG
ncbi:hypothetical protein K931_05441 [Aeromonas salmonicida subsp. pectinolytica 34mel]|nr:hypothetical protein K931_05441 [Aeromonas salmonicida subsp. pectinolytica 34mel]